jgi:D-alanine-D-alanine ligase
MQKIRVGVFMGGKSKECEVSLNSGRTICDHLDTACYEIVPLFQTLDGTIYILPWAFLYRGKIVDFVHRLKNEAQHITWDCLKKYIDFMYIAMHGRFAEDGTLQGMLELLQIPYFGSKVYASALGMDKIMQKKILQAHSIKVPKGIIVEQQHNDIPAITQKLHEENIPFPVIVKPAKEGSSLGTSIVQHKDQLLKAIQNARFVNKKAQPVLIEKKIDGMEFSCIVITDYKNQMLLPLPPTEIVINKHVDFFDYDQKYMPGSSLQYTPARCNAALIRKIQAECVKVMEILEFKNLGRIDGFLTSENEIIIIDPNSFSGAAPSSFLFKQAAQINMNHTQLINHFIETELHAYGIQKKKAFQKMSTNLQEKKIRVAVIMGGRSDEREISLESGRNVTYKLSPHTYEPIPLFLSRSLELYRLNTRMLVSNSTQEIEDLITPDMKLGWHELPSIADFVFIALHGGEGENGCVQGALEMLELPYNGSSILSTALCIDKFKTSQFLASQGFDVPRAMLISVAQWKEQKKSLTKNIAATLKFPCIVKPHNDGCSVMVSKANNEQELNIALETIFAAQRNFALVEEFIHGIELTVGVLGNEKPRALPPSQAIAQKGILSIQEKFLPGAGENQTPAPLAKKTLEFIQKTIEKAFTAVDCKGYARIDCFYQTAAQSPTKKERVVILEINTLPGLTPATCIFHQAAEIGLKPMDFIDEIIKLGFAFHSSSSQKVQEVTGLKNMHKKTTILQKNI